MDTSHIRKPRTARNGARAQNKATNANSSSLFREIVSIVVVGILLAVVMTDAVVGMADDLARGPVVPVQVAEVTDGR